VDDLQRRLRTEGDLDELAAWQKAFQKTVPLFSRSMVAGWLLSQWVAKAPLPRRKMNTITVFVSIGKNRRVYPRDLADLFSSTGSVAKADIGEIKILDNYSFVEVDDKLAAAVIEKLDGANFRGRRLTVNFAKKRPLKEQEAGAPETEDPR